MLEDRYAIYCFSFEKTFFTPVGYPTEGNKSFSEIINIAAWFKKIEFDNNGLLPKTFPDKPEQFKPKILSYATLQEIDVSLPMKSLEDNVFVVLMPEFIEAVDLELLELILHRNYNDFLKNRNITPKKEKVMPQNHISIASLTAQNVQVGNENKMDIGITADQFANALSSLISKPPEESQSIVEKIFSRVAMGATVAEAVSTLLSLVNK